MQHNPQVDGAHAEIRVDARLNGKSAFIQDVREPGPFAVVLDLMSFHNKIILLELIITPYFVPSSFHGTEDHRKLTALLIDVAVEPEH